MNPIIQRELLGVLRTGRALALQVALAAGLSVLVVLRWPTDALVDISGKQAQDVFRLVGYGVMVALILLGPVFPATSVVRERREGTLALLLNSPMSPWSIVAGKVLGAIGFVLLLIVLSLPVVAACFAMGGIDHHQILGVYGVLFLLSLQYTTLALMVSSYASTTDSALRLTYGLVLLLAVVTLGPHQFLQGGEFSPMTEWLRCVSPIPAMMAALNQGALGGQGLLVGGSPALRYAILALASVVLFTVWTVARFNTRMLDRSRAAGSVTDEQSAGVQAFRRVMYLWFFDPNRRTGLIGGWTNPVMVKEFRTRRFGRGYWLMRMAGLCLIASMGLMLATTRGTMDWGVNTLANIIILFTASLVILIAPSLAGGIISSERESGGWQLLQMTPLSSVTIVAGKLVSVVWTLVLILLATIPAYAVLIAIDNDQAPRLARAALSLGLLSALTVLLSAAASSLFRRTAPATATAYTLIVSLCAGTMLFWLGEDAPFSHATVESVLRFNPLAAALQLIDSPGFAGYRLLPFNWWAMAGGCAIALAVLVVQTWRLTRPW